MSMDEESSLLQTISTLKGQYKVNRFMFDIKIAPALWQRFMDQFIPNVNSILHPLYYLLRSNVKYVWAADCNRSFVRIKSEIASDRVLCHFNLNKILELATDASPEGVGAVLSHHYKDCFEKHITFASRSHIISERKYIQLDNK